MKLSVQIYSFIYSFIFGCCFYYILDIAMIIINKLNKIVKYVCILMFVMLMACLYFYILLFINNGVVHLYFLLCILVGYIFVYKIILPLFTHLRKK